SIVSTFHNGQGSCDQEQRSTYTSRNPKPGYLAPQEIHIAGHQTEDAISLYAIYQKRKQSEEEEGCTSQNSLRHLPKRGREEHKQGIQRASARNCQKRLNQAFAHRVRLASEGRCHANKQRGDNGC